MAFNGIRQEFIVQMKRDPIKFVDTQFDLVVIGGGIYGACIAWDAALRGLSVALIERGDFGQETSANSLKTVHGGLRYLQDFDLNLVRMMIEERSTYLRIAPHLVQPLACLTPTYKQLMKSKLVLGSALKINDLAGYDRNISLSPGQEIPNSQILSKEACRTVLPGLQMNNITGAAHWYDAQIYDTERLTFAFIASAASAGAIVGNYIEAVGLIIEENQIKGISARDVISEEHFHIRTRVVVNAAGPWIDQTLDNFKLNSRERIFNHSLAINIIAKRIIDEYAVGLPSWPKVNNNTSTEHAASHMLFVSPWRGKSIIGTFHSHFIGDPEKFGIQEDALQKIIAETNSAYPGAELTLDDIDYVHFGFLPEYHNQLSEEVKLVRKSRIIEHDTIDGISGLISVMGVKYTTARHAAEKVIDLVLKKFGFSSRPYKTSTTPIFGGKIDHLGEFLSKAIQDDSSILTQDTIKHWVKSYGTEYSKLRTLLGDSGEQIPYSQFSQPVINAQVKYAVREEMAIKLSDVLLRRTGIGSIGIPPDPVLESIANTTAAELGWSSVKKNSEIEEIMVYYRRHGSFGPMVKNTEIL